MGPFSTKSLRRFEEMFGDGDRRSVALPYVEERPTTVYPNKGKVQRPQKNTRMRVKNQRRSL